MYNVLVFPSCNEPAMEVIHALIKSNKFAIFGVSSLPADEDPSRHLLANHCNLCWLGDPDFLPRFADLLDRWRIDLVFPTVDAAVAEFAGWQKQGTRFVVPPPQTARLLVSKTSTYEALSDRVPVPKVYSTDAEVRFPAYAKPDCGAGSRGHRLIEDRKELYLARRAGLVVMEYLPGAEFTVDCLSSLSGSVLYANPRLRCRSRGGIAISTRSVDMPALKGYAQAISARLRLSGPWFAQFKVDSGGVPKLLEVNARVGGSMTLTRLEGVNIPALAAFMFLGHSIQIPPVMRAASVNRILRNVVAPPSVRCVIWDLDDTIIRKDGKADPDAVAVLVDLYNRGVSQCVLTRNMGAREVLDKARVPNVFTSIIVADDKVAGLRSLFARQDVNECDCIMVNDSNSERFGLIEAYPALRFITPDALEVLGREALS